ncbi:MAG: amylo-alpha-1,6-glucosidase [Spirochaetota bacterium]
MSTSTASAVQLNLRQVPFSRRETNWAVSYGRTAPAHADRLYLRYIYGGQSTDLYRIDLADGEEYAVTADPSRLVATAASGGRFEIACEGARGVRLRVTDAPLTLVLSEVIQADASWRWEELFPHVTPRPNAPARTAWRAIVKQVKHRFEALSGSIAVNAPWHRKSEGSHRHHFCSPFEIVLAPGSEIAIESYSSEWEPHDYSRSFDECADDSARDFLSWHEAGPAVADRHAGAAAIASYTTWSSIVPASGHFVRPTMLMSKRWMNNAWNWDNYFNAWASTLRDPAFALSQFHLHFDHQHRQGALGDGINELTVGWTYTKPPVHGWILRRMVEIHPYRDDEIRPFYEPLVRWTEWWFGYRDDDGDGICQYHHGNDSGWDDATAFDITPPVESPDLTALLVIQMDVLAELAERFGLDADASSWRERADRTLAALIEHSWRGDQFVAMQSGTHEVAENGSDSLLNFIPMVLGRRLPSRQRVAIVSALADEGRFLQPNGLSTESARSDHFLPEGYWRGPMWAPALMMIVDGLYDAGETALAAVIAERFCDACVMGGFAECFNPLTGAPLHDPAYTWTASVFSLLAHRLLDDPNRLKESSYEARR